VPYFCYLVSLRRSDSRGVAMRMTAPKRRSSFGTNCVRCGDELIAPERSEYRDEGQIRHFWHCSTCDCPFEVIPSAQAKSIEDIMRRIEHIMRRRDACSLGWSLECLGGVARMPLPYHHNHAARFRKVPRRSDAETKSSEKTTRAVNPINRKLVVAGRPHIGLKDVV
jgi:hypothetical protein